MQLSPITFLYGISCAIKNHSLPVEREVEVKRILDNNSLYYIAASKSMEGFLLYQENIPQYALRYIVEAMYALSLSFSMPEVRLEICEKIITFFEKENLV
jgi:hypothetical protein